MSEDSELEETSAEVSVEWKIKEFFPLKKETPYRIDSPTISLSDAKWYLRLYPDGEPKRNDSSGWVSLYLCRKCSSSEKHRVAFTLGVRKYDGSPFKSVKEEYEFQNNEGRGFLKFLKTSELCNLKDIVSKGSSLIVFSTARVTTARIVDENVVEAASQTSASESVQILQQNFTNLLLAGQHGDVTIKVHDQEFQAHRSILSARSPVFFSMFDHDTIEKKTGIVAIADFHPESFKQFLYFLYTGKVDAVSSSNAVSLYKAADKYDLKDLKDECVRYLSEELSTKNFCDVIILASMHNESELLETAKNFFTENAKSIFPTSQWHELMDENSNLANELLIKMANDKF